jgi:hypothetical protein
MKPMRPGAPSAKAKVRAVLEGSSSSRAISGKRSSIAARVSAALTHLDESQV